jgi:hypothetical protein
VFLSSHANIAWLRTRRATRKQVSLKSDLPPDLRLLREIGDVATPGTAVAAGALDIEKTIHNERMKLNANFLNSLAVWFAGAGSAGGLITTFMASSHNFTGAGEVAGIGVVLSVVLKLLANRAIGKLR